MPEPTERPPAPKTLSKGLQAAQEARAARAAAGIQTTVRNPLERLADNPSSLRAAINAKCFQCEGEDADPGVRHRIGTCRSVCCGLWAVRPYQRSAPQSASDPADHNNTEAYPI